MSFMAPFDRLTYKKGMEYVHIDDRNMHQQKRPLSKIAAEKTWTDEHWNYRVA